jgi:hypothetical protein
MGWIVTGTDIWWVGFGNSRTITTEEWATAGISDSFSISWNADNAWSIPMSTFTDDQIIVLKNDPEFLFGQDGLRTRPGPASSKATAQSALIYYEKVKSLYDEVSGIVETTPVTLGDLGGYTAGETDSAIAAAVAAILTSPTLITPRISSIRDLNGNKQWEFATSANAINFLQSRNAAAGNGPSIEASTTDGSQTNVPINVTPLANAGFPTLSMWASAASKGVLNVSGSSSAVGWNLTTKGGAPVQANGVNLLDVGSFHALAAKSMPIGADEFVIVDTAASNVLKKSTLANLQTVITAAIVNGAPGTLDTLKEIADAINDDANYAATLTGLLGAKANSSDVTTALNLKADASTAVTLTGNQIITGKTIDADQLIDGTTNKAFLATERTKLTSVAASATSNSSEASAPTALTLALRDSNANIRANMFSGGYVEIAQAGATTTLTAASPQMISFTGSGGQTIVMPTTGVLKGDTWRIRCSGSGNLIINSSAAGLISNISQGVVIALTSKIDTPTLLSDWVFECTVTSAPSLGSFAGTVPLRDSQSNILADTFIPGVDPTTASATTTTMTVDSKGVQILSGTTTHTHKLATASVRVGTPIKFINKSTGIWTINASNNDLVKVLNSGESTTVWALIATPAAGTDWFAS